MGKPNYAYPERTIDLDAVAEMFYESGNLVEEVYRAVGGDALPFFTMLAEGGELRERLLNAAKGYLREIEVAFIECGIYTNGGTDKVPPRLLRIDRLTPKAHGHRQVYQDWVAPIQEQGR
jgi:hypothetical protein